MKPSPKALIFCVILAVVFTGWTGCVGYVGANSGGYSSGGVWFHDDVWVDGGRGWYGGHAGGAYVHPGGREHR